VVGVVVVVVMLVVVVVVVVVVAVAKGKCVPVLAMKAHVWSRGIAPLILNLGTRWR
jgi:hypothetical protein